jgi:hypothetical protein
MRTQRVLRVFHQAGIANGLSSLSCADNDRALKVFKAIGAVENRTACSTHFENAAAL